MAIIEWDLGEELGIAGTAQAWDVKAAVEYFDSKTDEGGEERHLMARLVSITVDGDGSAGALARAQDRLPQLATLFTRILAEEAGFPSTQPAYKMIEKLGSTSPFLLAAAGLDEVKRDELLATYPRGARVLLVQDRNRKVIWSSVMRPPDQEEQGVLTAAAAKGKAGSAYLSLTRACTPWPAPAQLEPMIARYPAIPLLVIPEVLLEMGGGAAVASFRGRR